MQALVLFIVLILLFILGPILGLWGINTLFEQGGFNHYIPHNVWTYLAIWALMIVFKGGTVKRVAK